MLGDIQKAGGIGSLKKVDRSQIRDRSAAQVGGSNDSGPHASGSASAGAATAGGAGGGMADALAAALQKRKEKVSKSGTFNPPAEADFGSWVTNLDVQMMKTTTMTGELEPGTSRGTLTGCGMCYRQRRFTT